MKQFLPLFILSVLTIKVFAQDITVSFSANETIDSVQATNLSTNDTVSFLGNESLTLISSTSGISSVQTLNENIFPNPCNGSATIQFSTSTNDEVTIQIVNTSGQLITKKTQTLLSGIHSYTINFPVPDIYIVLVKTSNNVLSFKEIVNNTETQEASLTYTGNTSLSAITSKTITNKSATTNKTLYYSTGDYIIYTLYSGKNIQVVTNQPTESQTFDVTFYECADSTGRNYKTVTIGEQVWMAENLDINVETVDYDSDGYADYKDIFCWDNAPYGKLYTWQAARIACPSGWHLPSDTEWQELIDCLGGEEVAGGKMKATTGWNSPNTGATNSSGFTALPGGGCFLNGTFSYQGSYGYWWSSTPSGSTNAYYRHMFYNFAYCRCYTHGRLLGFSVRCVRD